MQSREHEDELPELGDLALDVPHQGLVEKLDPVGSCTVQEN